MFDFFEKTKNFLMRVWQGLRMIKKIRIRHLPQILESFTKIDFIVLTACALVFILAGGFLAHAYFFTYNSNIPDYGGEHIEGVVGQPRFINPVLAASSSVDSDLSKVVYSQLLKFDANQQLQPDLAQDLPTVSTDNKTYTIKLKSGLLWSDGKPLNADDVVFTIQTIQNPDYESPLYSNWNRVKVQKIDDLTIQFTLHEVSASFITNFTLGIIPKHIWDGFNANNFRLSDNNLQPVGSGPYTVHQIKKTSDGTIKSITLSANDNYYAGKAYISFLTFKFYPDNESLLAAYQSKDIDSLGYIPFNDKAYADNSDKTNQYQISLPQYQAVFFNLPKSAVLGDKSVRQALWLSTDRSDIINNVYLGLAQPAYGPILQGQLGYDPAIAQETHFSLSEAAQILDKGGWVLDPTTKTRTKTITKGKTTSTQPMEFTLATNNDPLNVKTAQILQQQWAQVGATVHLSIVSTDDLENNYIRPRNFDALLFSENTGADPDPFPFWDSSQSHDPGLNLSGYNNGNVDKLLTSARQTTNSTVRAKDYTQFEETLTGDIPAIFLDSAVYIYQLPKKEQGFDLTSMIYTSERFLDVNKWYIDTKRK